MQLSSFLFWLLFICCSIFPTNAELTYVKPSGTVESNGCLSTQPCLTLRDYAKKASQYFRDNTTFKFLPGIHYLEDPIQLMNISNLAFISSDYHSSTSVFLGPFTNISWTNCCNIQISGLIFGLSSYVQFKVRFHSSLLIFHRTLNVSLSQLAFFGIQSRAVNAYSSQVNLSDLTVSGALTGHSGAVVYALNSTLFFRGLNWFRNNSAQEGGAMAFYNSVSVFHGHALFLNNTAAAHGTLSNFLRVAGGAIFCNNSTISFKGSAMFKHNRVINSSRLKGGFGGAIAAISGSNLTFHSSANASFTFNSASFMGGALSVSSASKLLLQGQMLFEANSANNWGGAIAGFYALSIYCVGRSIKFHSNSAVFGGAFFSFFSKLRLEKILFEDNVAKSIGGSVYHTSGSYLQISNCGFVNNTANSSAGVAYIFNSTAAIFEGGYFKWNSGFYVGAIATLYTNIIFRNDNLFLYNYATVGRGSLRFSSSNALFDGNSIFRENRGGGIAGIYTQLSLRGRTSFVSNSIDSHGGGIRIFNGTINIIGQAIFNTNIAKPSGSTLYIVSCMVVVSGNVTVMSSSGILSSNARIQPIGSGAVSFISSKVIIGGTLTIANNSNRGIFSHDSEVCIEGCAVFLINQRIYRDRGGAVFARNSKIILRDRHNCSRFQFNVASVGGAIFAIDSSVELSGSQIFVQNSAERGGGLAFSGSSKLIFKAPFMISFVQNSALYSGGAIYHEDTFSISQCARLLNLTSAGPSNCFIEISFTLSEHNNDTRLSFADNTAGSAGAVLYGGSLDSCKLYTGGGIVDDCGSIIGGMYSHSPIHSILEISNIISGDNTTSDISSDPFQICFCTAGDSIDCKDQNIETVRGREFTLMAVIVGQNKGIVSSAVRTSLDNDLIISHSQRVQKTGKECTPISYRLSTQNNSTNLILFPDGPCRDIEFSRRVVHVSFLPCPDAFMLEGSKCVCEDKLQRYISSNSCNVDNSTIKRSSNTFWIGTIFRDNEIYEGLILHTACPFDYCVDTPVSVQLNNLDIQCDNNRSGTLCGSCISNYSIALGTLHCLPCSNIYLALLVPFAFAGIVLVTIILLLQLSVALGTVNGLIFYANIVQANYAVFFPPGEINILTVFISWVNLDLGFETCLYDGMTTFVYTWLQFSFPFYLWFLIGMMIIMSRHSVLVARAIGKNPVAALSTLFLLSYSKLIRTIIYALSFTSLDYPNDIEKMVWLYDANMPYFQTVEHTFLGIFALLVLLFLFLPYTLLLLCGQWLQAYSHWRTLSWINKLKPFMDAYHAPYKKGTRYWTGLLLLVRCVLFLAFTFNAIGNASVNLLAITSVTAGLIVLAWCHKRIYERAFNEILEGSFILNLCIFSATTYYLKESGRSQTELAYTSVGIAFAGFICILFYHVYVCLHGIAEWKRLPKLSTIKHYAVNKLINVRLGHKNEAALKECDTVNSKLPTVTVIELEEQLFET